VRHELNLVRLESDTLDASSYGDATPRKVMGGSVVAEFTNGEVTVSVYWPLDRYRNADFQVGDTIYVDVPEPEDAA
jgi:hypothetical protein